MNTMIPNKLSFSLDVQDLPARARDVERESMMKISGGCYKSFFCYADYGRGEELGIVSVWWNGCRIEDADWACHTKHCPTNKRCRASTSVK
ncbi:MAG: hypothetical protein HC764_19965 [Pleurocapsa sp. CRU_1_2]|nr:hypothetical protein [Pleurocapsa sp. CRU_1_2]